MKKIYIALLVLLMVCFANILLADEPPKTDYPRDYYHQDRLVLQAGLDFSGTHYSDWPFPFNNTKDPVDLGYSGTLEYQHAYFFEYFAGAGIGFEPIRSIKGIPDSFGFVPVYFLSMYSPFIRMDGFKPYFKFEIGYDFLFGNDAYKASSLGDVTLSGGIFFGFGVGARLFETIYVDLMYTLNSGNYEISNPLEIVDVSINYSKISLNIGIGFDLY